MFLTTSHGNKESRLPPRNPQQVSLWVAFSKAVFFFFNKIKYDLEKYCWFLIFNDNIVFLKIHLVK